MEQSSCLFGEKRESSRVTVAEYLYGSNVCVSKFICWNLSPKGDDIGKEGLWEVIRSWEFHGDPSPPSVMWRDKEKSATWKGAPPKTWPCWHPDLGLPASRWWETNFCCLHATTILLRGVSSLHDLRQIRIMLTYKQIKYISNVCV